MLSSSSSSDVLPLILLLLIACSQLFYSIFFVAKKEQKMLDALEEKINQLVTMGNLLDTKVALLFPKLEEHAKQIDMLLVRDDLLEEELAKIAPRVELIATDVTRRARRRDRSAAKRAVTATTTGLTERLGSSGKHPVVKTSGAMTAITTSVAPTVPTATSSQEDGVRVGAEK